MWKVSIVVKGDFFLKALKQRTYGNAAWLGVSTQLPNLWWMKKLEKTFGPLPQEWTHQDVSNDPSKYVFVSCQVALDSDLSRLILIKIKGKSTWNSHIGRRVLLESSWQTHSHGRVKTTFLAEFGIHYRFESSTTQQRHIENNIFCRHIIGKQNIPNFFCWGKWFPIKFKKHFRGGQHLRSCVQ